MPCYLPDSYTCLTRSIRDLQVLPSVTNDCIFIFVADPISQQMKQIIDPHQGVVHVHQIAIRAVGLYAGQVSQNGGGKIVLQRGRPLQPASGYLTDDEKSI